MIHSIRVRHARRAYSKALKARISYDRWEPNKPWDVNISAALHQAEAEASHRLAKLISPNATFLLGL